jgi:WD40 repeat protein
LLFHHRSHGHRKRRPSQISSSLDDHDETLIVSGGRDADTGERVLRIWSMEQRKTIRILRGYSGDIASIAFCPSGNTIASGSCDNRTTTNRVVEKPDRLPQRRLKLCTDFHHQPLVKCTTPVNDSFRMYRSLQSIQHC